MISKRRTRPIKLLARHMEALDRANKDEEQKVIKEVATIKRNYIKKYGRPKTLTDMPIKGIASEKDDSAGEQ